MGALKLAAVPSTPPDAELVERVVAGDPTAFEAIYRRHVDATFTLLTRLVGPHREREDLVQEVFIRLHPALLRFRGEASLRTLVFRIATRVAMDHFRHAGRRPLEFTELDDEPATTISPAETLQQREELLRALAQLARLTSDQRVAFVLHEVMDLTYDEAAAIVEASPDAVRMRVAAARRALDRDHGAGGSP